MNHHRLRSRFYLNRAFTHVAAGDSHRAADALRRSASHAVTAVAVNWRRPHRSRRRLVTALYCVIHDCRLTTGHLQTFRQVHSLTPAWLDSLTPRARRLALLRMHRRVRRLVADLERALQVV